MEISHTLYIICYILYVIYYTHTSHTPKKIEAWPSLKFYEVLIFVNQNNKKSFKTLRLINLFYTIKNLKHPIFDSHHFFSTCGLTGDNAL